jgi:hypothetical protein
MTKTHVIIHHSISADHPSLGNIGAIRDWHVNVNKWRDCGYHYVVEYLSGRPEVILGRMADEDGAHCLELGMNRVGIGICVVGDYDKQAPAEDTLTVLRRLCLSLMRVHGIPVENVWGHREAQAKGGVPIAQRKTCPGKAFCMESFRESLKAA